MVTLRYLTTATVHSVSDSRLPRGCHSNVGWNESQANPWSGWLACGTL